MMIFPLIGALIFGILALMTLLVTLGFPLGEYTLGGKYKVLPKRMRLVSASSFIIQMLAIIVILYVGQIISLNFSSSIARGLCLFFGFYLIVNSVMNFFSKSKKEKYVMTPLSLLASLCFFATVFL